MKLSTVRTVSFVLLFAARLGASQAVALTLSSVETHADNTVQLELFLNAPAHFAPAGLQWTFGLSPGLDIIGIDPGKAVKEAGKTLVCNGAKCIVYGMNRTTIPNGLIAILKMRVDKSLAGKGRSSQLKYETHGRARIRTPEIQIGEPVAASLDGKALPVVIGSSSRPIR